MKKKFIVGTLITASLLGCGTFTSCKDSNEDFRVEMTQEYNSLKSTLEKLQAQLNLLASECPEKCQQKIDALKAEMQRLLDERMEALQNQNAQDLENLKNEYTQKLAALQKEYEQKNEALQKQIEGLNIQLTERITALNDLIDALDKKTNALNDAIDKKADKTQIDALQKEIDTLKGQITAMQSQISSLENQITALNNQLKPLQDEITNLQTKITGLQEQIDKLKESDEEIIQKLADQIAALETFKAVFEEYKTTVSGQISGILERLQALEDGKCDCLNNEDLQAILALKGEIVSLFGANGTLAGLQGQIDAINQTLAGLEGLPGQIAGVKDDLTKEINDKINALRNEFGTRFDGLDASIGSINGSIGDINNQLGGINGSIGDINNQLGGINGSIGDINNQLGTINGSIGGINSEILKLWAEVADLGTIRQAIKDLQETCVTLTRFESEIKRLEELIAKNGGDISILKNDVLNLGTRLDGVDADIKKIKDEDIKELREAILTINGILTGVQGDITGLKGDVSGLKGDVGTLQGQVGTLNGQVGTLNGQVGTLQGQVGTLQGDVNGLKGDVSGLQGDVSGLQGDMQKVQDEVKKIEGLQSSLTELEKWFKGIGITVEQFQDYVKQGEFVKVNKSALEALVKLQNDGTLNEAALKALNSVYMNLDGINKMYTSIFEGAEAPEEGWWKYDKVISAIKENSAAILALQQDQEKIFARLNDMVTSLVLQATQNPVFGGVNTPFGINSLVLMTPYGERTTGVDYFPLSGRGFDCNGIDDIDWAALTSDKVNLGKFIVDTDANGLAYLGSLWFTVNPGTVNNLDLKGFALVNSRDDDPVVKLTNMYKDDETVLKFGVTSRAAGNGNGLYRTNVTVNPDDLDKIKVHIQDGLANTLKSAVKNHTGSDMAALARALYQQVQGLCDANALRYTYEAYTSKNANGTWNKSTQKVYSNYGVAATAYKPLSFATLKGTSIGRRVPTFSPIEIDKDLVNLDLGSFNINSSNFKLTLNFGKPHFDPMGNLKVKTEVELKDAYGNPVTGEVEIDITKQANEIMKNVTDAMNEWLDADGGLDARVEKAIWQALFNGTTDKDPKYAYDPSLPKGVVVSLQEQFEDMTGKIQDKLNSLVDQINKDYLGKVNNLIGKYNTVAERINNFLSEPNHYLQVTMLYRKAGKLAFNKGYNAEVELPFALLSTDPKQPTQFRGDGEAISLYATTYNFEVLCPAFRKMVAVTKVTDSNGNERNDLKAKANQTLAKVLPGNRIRVALDVAGAVNGTYTYELAYQAVDYSGFTSTVKCYLQVVR